MQYASHQPALEIIVHLHAMYDFVNPITQLVDNYNMMPAPI
jgi:hypothetical protein